VTDRIRTEWLVPVVAVALLVGACSSGTEDADRPSASSPAATAPAAADATAPAPIAATAPTTPTTAPAPTSPATTAIPEPIEPTETTEPTGAPPSTPPESTVGPEEPFTAAQMDDRELARIALISLAVFPDGWVEDPVEDDEDDPRTDAFEADFEACLGRDDDTRVGDDLAALAVRTGDFHPVDRDVPSVSHEVVLAPDEATAIAAMTEVSVDGAESCLSDVIRSFYEASFSVDPDLEEIEIADVVVTPAETGRAPDLAVGIVLEVPLRVGQQTTSQFLEILYQRQGRALGKLSFSAFGTPFDRDGYTVLSDEALSGLAAIGT